MTKYKNIVTTLYEGHYDYGVGALLNSLYESGFQGLFCIGYKGAKPFWLNQLTVIDETTNLYRLGDNLIVRLDLLEDVDMHFGYYKPYYLKKMHSIYPNCSGYYYFDPDIVILGNWNFFENWIKSGVALCQDSNYTFVSNNHPWRNKWRKDFSSILSNSEVNIIDHYINSGFIGCTSKDFNIIEKWTYINEKYISLGYPISFFDKDNGSIPYKGDQDVLNAVITVFGNLKLSILGKEAMGFDFPAHIMSHQVNTALGRKAWNTNYLKAAIKGRKISFNELNYFNYVSTPISLYTKSNLMKIRGQIKISKFINKLWN